MIPILKSLFCLLAAAACAGCVSSETPRPAAQNESESLVPGTIGITVRQAPAGVVVTAVGSESPAGAAGLRVGDVVLRYNGVSVADTRQFYRLMIDSRPGSTARLELMRDGTLHRLDVPVEQIDTTPRVQRGARYLRPA
jgi:S1-C subfamily serine protease